MDALQPLTLPQKLRSLADMAEQSNDRDALLSAVRYTLQEIDLEIDRRHPGRAIDELLGTKETAHG